MQKKSPSPEDLADAARLKKIFTERKRQLGITQEILGERMGFAGQSGVSHYLNGIGVLNISAAVAFAEQLQVPVGDFSPRLQNEIDRISRFASGEPLPATPAPIDEWPFSFPRSAYDDLSKADRRRINAMLEAYIKTFADNEKPTGKPSRAA